MAKPVSLVDEVQLHLYGPDSTTDRGTLPAEGASGHHSKDLDGSTLTFTAAGLAAAIVADPDVLDDAFAVPERFIGGSWAAFGTPYLLAPGPGTIYGEGELGDEETVPSGIGALEGLLGECRVLPRDPDPDHVSFRYAGGIEQNRYLGWMSIGYDETGDEWYDADEYDPVGHPKESKPPGWPGVAGGGASWVWHDPTGMTDDGSLTLFRFGTFTIASDTRVFFSSSSDENHKVYLDGPNMGCCIIDFSGDEDGYNDEPGHWSRRLKAGTYRVSGEMRTVDSDGGDGNDSMRLVVWYFGSFDRSTPTQLLGSGPDTRVHRQSATAERPGFTIGKAVRLLLEDNDARGVDAATLLLANATFTDDDDTSTGGWSNGREWVWPMGSTSLATALMDMQEDADFDMGPDFSFNAWDDRQTDLSSSVGLIPGDEPPDATMNIEGGTFESDPAGMNAAVTLSQDGFDLREGTVPTGSRRRLGFLELGSAPSIGRARRLADVAIRQARIARRTFTFQVMQVAGAVFYDDFGLCDRISGRDQHKDGAVQETLGFGWAVTDDLVVWTVETGEV